PTLSSSGRSTPSVCSPRLRAAGWEPVSPWPASNTCAPRALMPPSCTWMPATPRRQHCIRSSASGCGTSTFSTPRRRIPTPLRPRDRSPRHSRRLPACRDWYVSVVTVSQALAQVPRRRTATQQDTGIDAEVLAAGALCWRQHKGRLQVLVIHRPRYDDWSFPKGKLDDGETLPECAVREVGEEVGLKVRLGVPLPIIRYQVGKKSASGKQG